MTDLTEASLDELAAKVAASGERLFHRPTHVVTSPVGGAALTAFAKWQGHDRRRIKREVRKALKAARNATD